jgi:hypothetical protein
MKGPPHVKLLAGVRGGRLVVFAALSHVKGVRHFHYDYGRAAFAVNGEGAPDGGLTKGDLAIPTRLTFDFLDQSCAAEGLARLTESLIVPTCEKR